jgi:hypothetical protein
MPCSTDALKGEQLGERYNGIQKVRGSRHLSSTHLNDQHPLLSPTRLRVAFRHYDRLGQNAISGFWLAV